MNYIHTHTPHLGSSSTNKTVRPSATEANSIAVACKQIDDFLKGDRHRHRVIYYIYPLQGRLLLVRSCPILPHIHPANPCRCFEVGEFGRQNWRALGATYTTGCNVSVKIFVQKIQRICHQFHSPSSITFRSYGHDKSVLAGDPDYINQLCSIRGVAIHRH